jgi:hypothetical protein
MMRASSMSYKAMIFVRTMSLVILQEVLAASKFFPIGTTISYPCCLGEIGKTSWANQSDQYQIGQTGCPNRF